ncbi:hypothetical protein CEXT_163831 [Caerostris extrusa]|uniref:Uncharacterized protein n=1 Tax=Caerostris extrusa TaxID=172846 RepID=A0AAV4U8M4_CAEEX|nr:hypothetical protein CEXT_163831 [Caerostris extrusa]
MVQLSLLDMKNRQRRTTLENICSMKFEHFYVRRLRVKRVGVMKNDPLNASSRAARLNVGPCRSAGKSLMSNEGNPDERLGTAGRWIVALLPPIFHLLAPLLNEAK